MILPQYFDSDSESDSDLPSYFTPTAPYETPSSPSSNRRRRHIKPPNRSLSATPTPSSPASTSHTHHSSLYKLDIRRNDSLIEVLSQLWSKEGAWGIWKGTNSTFVYNVLLRTIETWTRSLLSAMLDLPDASLLSMGPAIASTAGGSLSILDSPNPLASVAIAVGAAGIAGLVLAPIDMVRTRYVFPSSSPHEDPS
jgi:fusion and transport protein UGO1